MADILAFAMERARAKSPGKMKYCYVAESGADNPAFATEMAHGMKPGKMRCCLVEPWQMNARVLARGMDCGTEGAWMKCCPSTSLHMNVPAFVMEIARGMKAERMRHFPSAASMGPVQAPQTNEERHRVKKTASQTMGVEIESLGSSQLTHACAMASYFEEWRQPEVVFGESRVPLG